DGSVVNARAAAPAPEGVLLPPNFNALPLQKPNVMLEGEKCLRNHRPVGFIDTDCLREIKKVFEAGELVGTFGAMQKLTSKTFQALISNVARKEWL
ncbi:MAG: hypothetical protein ACRD8U_14860, partial [Pyrinomonadaceae bacterium]